MHFEASSRSSALSGIAVILVMQIESGEVIQTIVLAGIGGISSYLVTVGLKFLIAYVRKKY
mgnify:CR=1 FL=1